MYFCLNFMLQSTKNHWKSLKILCFSNDFADFKDFRFSACWRQFWQMFRWFSRDLALKMIVEALICFPLASLGSNWGQLSAFLGQSWTPQSLILDALPCLGNIFVAWDPPDAFEDRFFKTFDLNSADIPMQPKHLLCCWMTVVLRKQTPHRLYNFHIAESLSLQASESPSSLGGWREAQTISFQMSW